MENRLEKLRTAQGVTQEELAASLEVSRQTIGSLEKGRYNPSILLAFKIARYFKYPLKKSLFMRRIRHEPKEEKMSETL